MQQWDPEKIKRAKRAAAQREKARIAKLKKTVTYLSIVTAVGALLLIYDIFLRSTEPAIALNFMNQEGTVKEWLRSGFAKSKDDAKATIVLNEELWDALSDDRRTGVVLLIKAYFKDHKARTESILVIKGDKSTTALARVRLPAPVTEPIVQPIVPQFAQ